MDGRVPIQTVSSLRRSPCSTPPGGSLEEHDPISAQDMAARLFPRFENSSRSAHAHRPSIAKDSRPPAYRRPASERSVDSCSSEAADGVPEFLARFSDPLRG